MFLTQSLPLEIQQALLDFVKTVNVDSDINKCQSAEDLQDALEDLKMLSEDLLLELEEIIN